MKKYIIYFTLIIGCLTFFNQKVSAQEENITVSGQVIDSEGNAVSAATVYYQEGAKVVKTDAEGNFSITDSKDGILLIIKEGYENISVAVSEVSSTGKVTIEQNAIGLTNKDLVAVPFGTTYSRYIAGSVTNLDVQKIQSSDYRQGISAAITGRTPGLRGWNNRGIGNPILIVDGIPRWDFGINLDEVESISVLRDGVSRTMYGSQAQNGVIIVNTKRGTANKRVIRFSAEQGFNTVKSYPNFLGAQEYMTKYNEARANDGLSAIYSDDDISNTDGSEDNFLYPSNDFYNSDFVRNSNAFQNIFAEASGGNNNAQYYLNVGYNRSTGLITVGEGANEVNNNFNIRGNVQYNITDWMRMRLDGIVMFNIDRSPLILTEDGGSTSYWDLTANLLPNAYALTIDTSNLSLAQQDAVQYFVVDDDKIWGGTNEYTANVYADLHNGYLINNNRVLQNNTGFDFDLGGITEGLSASVDLTFDLYNFYLTVQQDNYGVFEPVVGVDSLGNDSIYFNQIDDFQRDGQLQIGGAAFYRRIGSFAKIDYNRLFNGVHRIDATALAYTDLVDWEGQIQRVKNLNFGLRANYINADKYVLNFNVLRSGTSKLAKDNRMATSASAGLGWILSEESFLSGNSTVNYLKLFANAGSLKTVENLGFYEYLTTYNGNGNWDYNFTQSQNTRRRIDYGNADLGWATVMDMNIGFESVIANSLSLNMTYFTNTVKDLHDNVDNVYPAYVLTGMENYSEFQTSGIEWGLEFNKKVSDIEVTLGTNGLFTNTIRVQDNIVDYIENDRDRNGEDRDARYGLQFDRFYTSADFTNGELNSDLPLPVFGAVKPGDLKYVDINGDGFISEKDETIIGKSTPDLNLGLYLNLKYKAVELFVLGLMESGRDNIMNSAYYWNFGTRKYSDVVNGAWTEATASTATYPRLTSLSSANNFRTSDFWLYNANFFEIQTVQLTYTLPFALAQRAYMKGMQVYVRGNNLVTIGENADKLDLNVGRSPKLTNYAVGLKLNF